MSNAAQNNHASLALTTISLDELTRVSGGEFHGQKGYVVQKGDNLTKIAKAHGVTVDQLKAHNVKNRKNPDLIHPGESLIIDPGQRIG